MPTNSIVAAATTIQAGQVIIINDDALPIYKHSAHYVSGARVIPDGTTWIEVITNNGKIAFHESELGVCVKASDENGKRVYTYNFPLITARTSRGNKYFTSEKAAERANFKFSLRLGHWADANDATFYGNEKLLSYHTLSSRVDKSKLPVYHNESDEYLLGIEVEKTDTSLQQDGEAWQILQETGWSKESDASLNSGGYELVSPILPLYSIDRIETACEPVSKWIDGRSDDSCGGHFNISKRNTTNEELLESMKQFAPIIYALYKNRLTNRFCAAKQWRKYFEYREKYSAFYLKGDSIVEIRLFGRITNMKTLKWRVKLMQLLLSDGGNLNQLAQRIGCPESSLYKFFAEQYSHERIGEKLRQIDEYAKKYGTHRNGISPSVKKRINNTMGYDVFAI